MALVAELRPALVREWDLVRNQGLDPRRIGPRSTRKVWWRCRACGHHWQATPDARAKGYGCPRCGRARAGEATRARNLSVAPESSIAALRPDLAVEWHLTRNQRLDPWALGVGSNVVVWWRCTERGREWQTTPHSHPRARGPGYRSCSSRKRARERWRRERSSGLAAVPGAPPVKASQSSCFAASARARLSTAHDWPCGAGSDRCPVPLPGRRLFRRANGLKDNKLRLCRYSCDGR